MDWECRLGVYSQCKNDCWKEEYSPSRLDAGLLGKGPAHRLGEYLFLFFFLSQMTKNESWKEEYSPCRILGHLDVGPLGKGPSHGVRV